MTRPAGMAVGVWSRAGLRALPARDRHRRIVKLQDQFGPVRHLGGARHHRAVRVAHQHKTPRQRPLGRQGLQGACGQLPALPLGMHQALLGRLQPTVQVCVAGGRFA